MAPWITILIGGLIGFIWNGLLGALVGLACGYVLSLLLGGLIFAIGGGLVPRKAKQETARHFLESFREHAQAAFPGLDQPAQLRAIEDAIEKVFRRY